MSELCPGTPAGVCLRIAQTEGIKARDMQQSLRQKSSIFDDPATQPAYENPKARYAALYPALKDIMHMPK